MLSQPPSITEFEITPQMLRAGEARSRELADLTSSSYLVSEIFRAMMAQSRQVIEDELARLHHVLTSDKRPDRYDELYAAQQALAWTLDPATFKAPSQMLDTATLGPTQPPSI